MDDWDRDPHASSGSWRPRLSDMLGPFGPAPPPKLVREAGRSGPCRSTPGLSNFGGLALMAMIGVVGFVCFRLGVSTGMTLVASDPDAGVSAATAPGDASDVVPAHPHDPDAGVPDALEAP